MQLEVKDALIIRADAQPGAAVGVAQIRAVDPRGRLVREGVIAMLAQGNGREARITLSPDEARELGNLLIVCSYAAADAPPPVFASSPAAAVPGGGVQ